MPTFCQHAISVAICKNILKSDANCLVSRQNTQKHGCLGVLRVVTGAVDSQFCKHQKARTLANQVRETFNENWEHKLFN